MAVQRDRPYVQFNFLVDLGNGTTDGADAGFQEVSGVGSHRVRVPQRQQPREQRHEDHRAEQVHRRDPQARRDRPLSLYSWLNQIRNGDQNALRTVTIQLQNEDHTQVVQTWKLRARIIKHTSGPFNAKGTDVAMEELVLAYERLEME